MFLAIRKSASAGILMIVLMAAATPLLKAQPDPPPGQEDKANLKFGAFDEKKVQALLEAAHVGCRLKTLLKARHDAALAEVDATIQQFRVGRILMQNVQDSTQHLFKVELELAVTKDDQIAVLEAQLRVVKQLYEIIESQYKKGRISVLEVKISEFYFLDAQIALERAKEK